MLDLTNVESSSYQLIPVGEYPFIIAKVEIKTSKAGQEYMKLELACRSIKHHDARVWENLNLWHPTEQVKEIAMKSLKGILVSGKVTDFKFPNREALVEKLHGLRICAKIKHEHDDQYGDKAVVHYYPELKEDAEETQSYEGNVNPADIPF